MKKIITLITLALISIMSLTGCESIKNWWNNLDFGVVANTIAPTIRSSAKYTVYAVCKKNSDLNPIFIASANGILIAVNSSSYSTDQIKDYIKQALGDKAEIWYPLISTEMDTILSWYSAIYNKYFDKADNDKLRGFNTILAAMANGVIEGANMNAITTLAKVNVKTESNETVEIQRAEAIAEMKASCAQFGIEIK